MSETNSDKKPRVMLVDDSRTVRAFLSTALEQFGFEMHVFESAVHALENLEQVEPDCILTDFEMLNMTGLEFIKEIRSRDKFSIVPILVLSSKDQDEIIVECVTAGAEDYILKRTNPEVLVSKVSMLIELKNSRDNQLNLERVRTFKATTVTLNHELNNLSAILLPLLDQDVNSTKALENIKQDGKMLLRNLTRLIELIKELKDLDQVSFENYIGTTEMLELKKNKVS
ncbi:MAG: response regulator [Bdellovibrionales bacterium]|nr:response regulator [Bdellovibrionales bacterium]